MFLENEIGIDRAVYYMKKLKELDEGQNPLYQVCLFA